MVASRSDAELVALANQLLTGGKGPYKDPRYFDDTFYDVEWMTTSSEEKVLQKQLLDSLLLPLKNQKPEMILLTGVHGIGKSFFAHKAAEIARMAYDGQGRELEVVVVDCKTFSTHYDIMSYLHRRLGVGHDWNPKTVVDGLREKVESGKCYNIILDDLDCVRVGGRFKDKTVDNVVSDLWGVNHGDTEGALVLTCTTNDIQFEGRLTSKTAAKIDMRKILVRRPAPEAMEAILSERIDKGLINPHKYKANADNMVNYTVSIALSEGDCVRSMLRIAKKAIDHSAAEGTGVAKKHVLSARDQVRGEMYHSVLRCELEEHEKLTITAIAYLMTHGSGYQKLSDLSAEVVFTGEAYEAYQKLCKRNNQTPRTLQMFGRYLKRLEECGLVKLSISGMGVRGTTTLIRMQIDCNIVLKILGEYIY